METLNGRALAPLNFGHYIWNTNTFEKSIKEAKRRLTVSSAFVRDVHTSYLKSVHSEVLEPSATGALKLIRYRQIVLFKICVPLFIS